VTYSGSTDIAARRWRNGRKTADFSFSAENPVYDPITLAFFAKSLDFKVGGKYSFDVFNGKHRYLIVFEVLALESFKGKMAYKILPAVKKLTDTEEDERLRSVYIWVLADSSRDILALKSDVWVGSVNIEMESFR